MPAPREIAPRDARRKSMLFTFIKSSPSPTRQSLCCSMKRRVFFFSHNRKGHPFTCGAPWNSMNASSGVHELPCGSPAAFFRPLLSGRKQEVRSVTERVSRCFCEWMRARFMLEPTGQYILCILKGDEWRMKDQSLVHVYSL